MLVTWDDARRMDDGVGRVNHWKSEALTCRILRQRRVLLTLCASAYQHHLASIQSLEVGCLCKEWWHVIHQSQFACYLLVATDGTTSQSNLSARRGRSTA